MKAVAFLIQFSLFNNIILYSRCETSKSIRRFLCFGNAHTFFKHFYRFLFIVLDELVNALVFRVAGIYYVFFLFLQKPIEIWTMRLLGVLFEQIEKFNFVLFLNFNIVLFLHQLRSRYFESLPMLTSSSPFRNAVNRQCLHSGAGGGRAPREAAAFRKGIRSPFLSQFCMRQNMIPD